MGPEKMDIRRFFLSVIAVVLVEITIGWAISKMSFPHLWVTGCIRMIQAGVLVFIFSGDEKTRALIGLSKIRLIPGIRAGLTWSLGFGVAAAIGFLALFLSGANPFLWIRSPLPQTSLELILYFVVGGMVAPVAEELFFRGVIYGFFRQWGIWFAVVASTLVFALFHTTGQMPVTQLVGGLVFAIAYEHKKSLATPVLIHMLGNISIFTLSLPWVQKVFS